MVGLTAKRMASRRRSSQRLRVEPLEPRVLLDGAAQAFECEWAGTTAGDDSASITGAAPAADGSLCSTDFVLGTADFGPGLGTILGDDVVIPFGGKAKAQFTDADGDPVTVQLKGPGSGEVRLPAANGSDAVTIIVNGTDATSSLILSTKGRGSETSVVDIVVNGSLKALTAKTTDLLGDLTVTGTVKKLQLDDVAEDHAISIGAAADPRATVAIVFDRVRDLILESGTPIKSLTVAEWLDTGGLVDAILAPWLGKLTVKGRKGSAKKGLAALAGDLEAEVILSGAGNPKFTLANAKVAGQIAGGRWLITGDAGSITAGSTGAAWAANFSGFLSKFTVKGDAGGTAAAQAFKTVNIKGNLSDAQFLAGANLGSDAQLGGTGGAADTFGPGAVGKVSIAGSVANSIVGAGLDPVDGVLNNAGDVTLGGPASSIKSLTIKGGLGSSRIFAAVFPRTVKIDGSKVDPFTDTRLVAGLQAIGLSRATANPGSALVVTADGFDPDASADIIFTDDAGNEVRVPALAGSVAADQLEAIVPAYLDAETFALGSGTMSVSVDQGTNVLFGPAEGFEIHALGATGLAPGSVALETFDLLRDLVQAAALHWQVIDAASDGAVNSSSLESSLGEMRDLLADQRDEFVQLVNGQVDEIHLGRINGHDVALDDTSLALLDQMFMGYFLGDDAPGASTLAQGAGGHLPVMAGDTMDPYREAFDADLARTFEEVFEEFKAAGGIASAGVNVGFLAAGLFSEMGAAAAAAASGTAGALLYWATTVAPAVMSFSVLSMASPFIELELGYAPTMDVYQEGLDHWSNGSLDYLDNQVKGKLIKGGGKAFKLDKEAIGFLELYNGASESTLKTVNPDLPASLTGLAYNAAPAIYDKLNGAVDAVMAQTGAARNLALRAMLQAMIANPNGDLVLAEAVAMANELINAGSPGATLSRTSGLVTTEAGGSDSFTIVLTGKPEANVTIPMLSTDHGEGTHEPGHVTFTPDNWNVPQTVTAIGVDDDVDDGDQPYAIITGGTISQDPYYDRLLVADAGATNLDDDEGGVTVTPTGGLVTSEGGGSATFTIVLDTQPTANVTIGLSSSDTTEGAVSKSSLTFTPSNWNTPQTVKVRGRDDSEDDGDIAYTITTAPAASADPLYSGWDAPDVSVTNTDDDEPPQPGRYTVVVIVIGTGHIYDLQMGRIDTRVGDTVGNYGPGDVAQLVTDSGVWVDWFIDGSYYGNWPFLTLFDTDMEDGVTVLAVFP